MDFINLNWLHDDIAFKEFPLGDSIYEFLHPNRARALQTFARLVEDSVYEYDKHYPLSLWTTISSSTSYSTGMTFTDNFKSYLSGCIDEDDIQLVPEAIALVRSSFWSQPTTANNWHYKKPTLYGITGSMMLKYYTYHPVVYDFSPDGKFTEWSGIYYVPESDQVLIDQVSLNILTYLRTIRESVRQPTGLEFFDFSNRIDQLKQSLLEDYSTSAELYEMWR